MYIGVQVFYGTNLVIFLLNDEYTNFQAFHYLEDIILAVIFLQSGNVLNVHFFMECILRIHLGKLPFTCRPGSYLISLSLALESFQFSIN